MLEELRISNFAIIDDLDITFSQGMSALLGETGAGKSIVVEALSLLSGKRAEFDKLKDETKKAFVEGTFVFSEAFIASHPALNDYLDGKRITVSRSLLPSRSAVSRINGETVSNSVLKNVMDGVIDIHSQGDSALLLDESSYLGLLDSYKKDDKDYQEALSSYQAAYKALNEASKEVSSFVESNDLAQKEFLSYQAKEIQEAHLAPHEIEDLNEELEANDKYEELQNAFIWPASLQKMCSVADLTLLFRRI
jgi:DNA repair protein RecN (Recombination protein N)